MSDSVTSVKISTFWKAFLFIKEHIFLLMILLYFFNIFLEECVLCESDTEIFFKNYSFNLNKNR